MKLFIKIFVLSVTIFLLACPGTKPTPPPSLNCSNGYAGTNNVVGLPTGDPRFVCSDAQWYSCGWDGSGSWDIISSDNQIVGSWRCDLKNSTWNPSSQPTPTPTPTPTPFPKVPTRDQVTHFKLTFQGLTVNTVQYGALPWFEPALVSLNAADRQSVYIAKHAAGDTHLIIGFSKAGFLYNEPNQPYENFQVPDYEANLQTFLSLVEEIIQNGFVPVIAFDGDDADNPDHGYPNALRQLPILVNLLRSSTHGDLNNYVLYARLWDGVFYGSTPENIQSFGSSFRSILPNGYLAIEHNTGHIPVGGGPGDYQPGGKMVDYDVILSEFDGWIPDGPAGDQVWQIAGRLLGPQYIRPSDQPSGDDTNPPFYLGNSPRGPYVAAAFEFDEYRWVRGQVTLDQVNQERQYFKSIGYQWGDIN